MVRRPIQCGYDLRVVLLGIGLALMPVMWIAGNIFEYRSELAAIQRIKKIAPDCAFEFRYRGPDWMARIGFTPRWLERVHAFDATGAIYGANVGCAPEEIPFDFGDQDWSAIQSDVQQFQSLQSLYLLFSKMTDDSLDSLKGFDSVRFFNLQQTAMTSEAVKKLEADLPDAKIAFFHDLQVEPPRKAYY